MFDRKLILINLIFFSVIVLVVIFHYFTHFRTLKKEIISYVQIQANSIAKRIEISATNIVESQKFIKKIIEKNLESQAKFIDLLNSVEPFKDVELKDYAEESNLEVIVIISKNHTSYYLPKYFSFKEILKFLSHKDGIIFLENKNLILYKIRGFYSQSIIFTGIYAKKFFEKSKKLSLSSLIHRILNQREDVKEIKIINGEINHEEIKLKNNFYIIKIPFEAEKGKIILIKIDAYYPLMILKNFKHNIYVFILVMIFLGIIGNFLIFYIQKKYIFKIREFEKEIAKSEKDAALGRTAALIAHELRNPINAIGMGIQRIMYETEIANDTEYFNLLKILREEVERINKTIEDFLNYTKPVKIRKIEVELKSLLESVLIMFKDNYRKFKVFMELDDNFFLNVDREFFKQVIINLIKNVFENDKATYLRIKASKKKNIINIIFENDGVELDLEECNKIFEPYFTTKTRGSGLGLAIVKKIIEAHNGNIFCELEKNVIKFIINIPIKIGE